MPQLAVPSPDVPNGELLTVQQVADRLKVNSETVRRWLRSGQLRGYLLGGDRAGYRVAEDDLEGFIRSRRKGMDEAGLIRTIESAITAIRERYPQAGDDIRIELGNAQFEVLQHRSDVQQSYLELLEPFRLPGRGGVVGPHVSFTRTSRKRFPVARIGVEDHLRVVGAGPWEPEG